MALFCVWCLAVIISAYIIMKNVWWTKNICPTPYTCIPIIVAQNEEFLSEQSYNKQRLAQSFQNKNKFYQHEIIGTRPPSGKIHLSVLACLFAQVVAPNYRTLGICVAKFLQNGRLLKFAKKCCGFEIFDTSVHVEQNGAAYFREINFCKWSLDYEIHENLATRILLDGRYWL